ncbi:hypothetical protein KXD40_005524 [Peronospora effusa]|nr:hypothetical protein KXD40_005524 [Peronospora effusa]
MGLEAGVVGIGLVCGTFTCVNVFGTNMSISRRVDVCCLASSSVIFIRYWVLTCYTNESYVIVSTHTAEPGTLHPRSRGFSRLA